MGPEEMEASGSTLSHLPSQSLVRRQNTRPTLRLSIVWKFKLPQPKMEELHYHLHMPGRCQWWKTCFETANLALQKQLWQAHGWVILFYGRQSLGEGLSLGEAWDSMFMLTGAINWVGKQAQLNAIAVSLWEGWQLITQAVTKWCIQVIITWTSLLMSAALPLFSFCNQDEPPWEERLQSADECLEVLMHTHWKSHPEWGHRAQWGWDHGQQQWELWAALTLTPSPDYRFESDRSSVSTFSSVSSRPNRSRGSRHQHHGQYCWEPRGHMKINLPIFKDEDKKDAITYHSWHWDIMVYHQARCQDCTLLPYVIHSLQDYPGELVRNLATDITLDGMIAVLDEHYNNVKALDAFEPGAFQILNLQ